MAPKKTDVRDYGYNSELGFPMRDFRMTSGTIHEGSMESGFTVGSPVGVTRGMQGVCESIMGYLSGVVIVTVNTGGDTRYRIIITAAGQGTLEEG
jgi:hypothetical protein